ncbi:phage holin family protein [Trueperella pecoris]|uniref:Phage holin family protein n=1 Tax=Trueperella pecoris TaxID=2733571 RepID=A0A7M1R3C2_9ACTO|nr:phage holin family protein [Trueperella pecoris]QOR47997.1 phage holin family protein [Trueperella pecoris]
MTDNESHIPQGPSTLSGKGPVASGGQSIGELVAKITAQFSALARDEISFAKLQAVAKVKKLGIGGALFAVAGVLALYMLGTLLLAAGYGLATVMPLWAAFLVVSGILLLIIILLAVVGLLRIKASQKHVIDPKAGLKKDIDAVKKGMN